MEMVGTDQKEISEGFRHTTNNRMELLELLLD
jgi:ribonuclease HI